MAAHSSTRLPSLLSDYIPMSIMTDSYKATHFLEYPACQKMVAVSPSLHCALPTRPPSTAHNMPAEEGQPYDFFSRPISPAPAPPSYAPQYAEFRSGFEGDTADTRFVWYGLRYIVDQHVSRRWTRQDVDRADALYAGHLAPAHAAFPYPRDLFLRFIEENDGYMPVRIEALPEGTCAHAHVPVFQASAHMFHAQRRPSEPATLLSAARRWACPRFVPIALPACVRHPCRSPPPHPTPRCAPSWRPF
jgi:hypothetical protein